MKIIKADPTHIPAISEIANITWNATYRSIVSQEQIDFMLQLYYNEKLLHQQMQNGKHHFWVATEQHHLLGYIHAIEDETDLEIIKLSKLYVLPETQGRQIGKALMYFLESECKEMNKKTITLNVNRSNPAQHFYTKMGYTIVEEVDIPLDKYWLNDYVMEKNIGETV